MIETFIGRWSGARGSERGDAQSFLNALCDLIAVPKPHDHRGGDASGLDYAFERPVRFLHDERPPSPGWIDLYKRGSFVLEAKQSSKRQRGGDTYEQLPLALRPPETAAAADGDVLLRPTRHAQAAASPAWDALMRAAKRQAESYARCLDEWPPFILVVDVGHVIEVYADFSRQGKNYAQFPDRRSFRITMEDLRSEEIRDRLRRVWDDPFSLDPAARAAAVTQSIAVLLARMTQSIERRTRFDGEEQRAEHAYSVSKFLMRCIFAMFAESVGLLPARGFITVIEQHLDRADRFHLAVADFFGKMDTGGYSAAIREDIRRFNGGLFREAITVEVTADELALLHKAAAREWRDVEPAIFGTLLEQALSDRERARLGAHYTPRAYVERLVVPTVIEPLREDWDRAQADAVGKLLDSGPTAARQVVKRFHDRLCETVVLDPACGTGNFLYVALELMKRLEGEVLEFLKELGEPSEPLRSVHPSQFRGIEKNPRAVPIAELVLWIGYIQWWFRTRRSSSFADPVLDEMQEIAIGDAVLAARTERVHDGAGRPATEPDPQATRRDPISGEIVPDPAARREIRRYLEPRPALWPAADFIVGNPPFIGGKDLRAELGSGYLEALWASRGRRSASLDLVMYWWDQAATLLRAENPRLRRFGFITTNSITQTFSRRVLDTHLRAPVRPISLVFAVPDHPWVKTGPGMSRKAAVRIAMTVAERGTRDGKLARVVAERALDTDQPEVDLALRQGRIRSDLTIGADVTSAVALAANSGLCSPGVKLHGDGFIVTPADAAGLGLGRVPGLDQHIRPYRNGRDLANRPRGVMVIDLFGLDEAEVRRRFPAVWQRLRTRVKPERDVNNRKSYRDAWWIFGEPRSELRAALAGLPRYIVTIETAKHRVFSFLDAAIRPDNMLVAIASDDAWHLGVLSSRIHVAWTGFVGGTLEDRPRYTKSRCFDPFPFPVPTDARKAEIRALTDELDALRQRVLDEHALLTLTRLYNVRARLVAGASYAQLDEGERAIHDLGCVAVLDELHRRLDAAVAAAYGWPAGMADDEIVARVVALNAGRRQEERAGRVRWLRPAFQAPDGAGERAVRPAEVQEEADLPAPAAAAPALPRGRGELAAAVWDALRRIGGPAEPIEIAGRFVEGRRGLRRVEQGLEVLAAVGLARRAETGWFAAERTS